MELPHDVYPGQNVTFTFPATAPQSTGTYDFQWKMIREGAGWFGALTDNVAISVQAAQGAGLNYIHVDHLDTPRLVADAAGTTVWRWDQMEPFGVNVADDDPDANSIAFEFPLRFPGQYFDKETNFHYNYFRDYDSAIGRYVESDPIGLDGGLNTYLYVDAAPLVWSDSLGLAKGGKKNLNTEGFTKKSDPKQVEQKMNEAKQAGQQGRYKALRALLKVIKRGGTMGLIWGICEAYDECQKDPCSCDPYSVACLLSPGDI